MSTATVESVKNWPVPRNVKDIQAFLGFANFYWRIIEGISRIYKPLTDLTVTTIVVTELIEYQ